MGKFAQGKFEMKHPEKYIGKKNTVTARSSWEFVFMKMLDEHSGVEKWASESIQIPYRDPLNRKTILYMFQISLLCIWTKIKNDTQR